ncbi:MAG: hypothetical protein AMXMBFR81_03350 [Chthonomonas sp.]
MRLILPLVAALAATGGAQIVQKGDTTTFRITMTKGQVLRYQQTTRVTGDGLNMQMSGPFVLTVANVRSNIYDLGVATGPMTSGGRVVAPLQTAQISIDPTGRTIEGTERAFGAAASLPPKPLKVGGKWTEETELPVGGGQPSLVETTYTFKGFQTLNKKRVAVLAATLKGKGQIALNGSGTVHLDPADGTLLRYELTSNTTLSGGAKPVRAKSTTTVARQ